MKNPLPRVFHSVLKPPFPVLASVLLSGFIVVTFLLPDVLAAAPPGNEAASGEGNNSSFVMAILFGLGLLVLAAIVVGGLTLWGKKQDDINHMMSFCIKFLIDTQNEAERCKAARALGVAKDPGALLVLVDVVIDEKAEDTVREAAQAALEEMGLKYRKYKKVIKDLLSAVRDKDHQKVIDLLNAKFETDKKKYVQTAYVIGREYIRLGNHADAREWLHVAVYRNRNTPTYGNQIRALADICNQHLFAEGDRLFNAGYFQDAKAQYALASQGLGDEEKKRFASYLRQASVYCKLEDYEDADQALLQALQHHHETDMTLTLNKLLQKLLDQGAGPKVAEQEREQLDTEIDECVSDIMKKLTLPTPER